MTRDQVVALKKGDLIHYDFEGEHLPGAVQRVAGPGWDKTITVYVHVPLQRRVLTVDDLSTLHLPADCPQARRVNNYAVQPTLL